MNHPDEPLAHEVTDVLCHWCNGAGRTFSWLCSRCDGHGTVEVEIEDYEECWDEPYGGD